MALCDSCVWQRLPGCPSHLNEWMNELYFVFFSAYLAICRLLCWVGIPSRLDRPSVVSIFPTNVTLSYRSPGGRPVSDTTVLIYTVKYRKYGCTEGWKVFADTNCQTITVIGLQVNSRYDFSVSARYEDGESGLDSPVIKVWTKTSFIGRCALCTHKVQLFL